ncbi:hypothetical protein [Cesiribacter sp. SM1]|uniref:hypothetical protein n=1 Tax=Cesiribacter sp. SM1 TaxID=2861196 RepID=UPI001CD79F55|nr:hypothetical protein [Cesiribacter sp. SM1]
MAQALPGEYHEHQPQEYSKPVPAELLSPKLLSNLYLAGGIQEYQELKNPTGLPKIGAHKQILEFKKNNWQLRGISEICISEDSAEKRDLFSVPYDHQIYISEKLVNALNLKGITGIAIRETNKIKRLPTTE